MAMELVVENKRREVETIESNYMRGVRHLCEGGITRVPKKYILPLPDRPESLSRRMPNTRPQLRLPAIDLAQLKTVNRTQVLKYMAKACEEYGFFQVVNHGITNEVLRRMSDVGRRFFELPYEERARYMSADIRAPVRCGTSFNQTKDGVFCWRDFLKLNCQPLETLLPYWPSSPTNLREEATSYAKQTKSLFFVLMGAILETLGVEDPSTALRQFDDGTHLMVLNCYPSCPEPELTLGMPPHSDYGFLTILLQDDVGGLEVQSRGEWVAVEPVPGSFVVNVGDHLEIFSNGRYKSVLHRVVVNSSRSRISVASLHSVPYESVVSSPAELITDENPRVYKDTDFAAFLDYMSACETKHKNFLESRRLTGSREET